MLGDYFGVVHRMVFVPLDASALARAKRRCRVKECDDDATIRRHRYLSQCLEVDVASQGESEEDALANLKEALELHFEPPQATRPSQKKMTAP